MKRFIISVLFVSVFCIGLGALVDNVGAKFKSDERALDLIAKARQAIGGDSNLVAVKSLSIFGKTTRTRRIDGADRTYQNDTEIAMQLPDKVMFKSGRHEGDGAAGEKIFDKKIYVIVSSKMLHRSADGTATFTTKDGKTMNIDGDHAMFKTAIHGEGRAGTGHSEVLRLTLGLLLTAPEGMDVNYQLGGDGDVDGTACNIVVAEYGGQSFRIYLGKSSNLPIIMSYTGVRDPQVFTYRTKAPDGGTGAGETKDMVFTRTAKAPDTAEFSVRFSDYRLVGGLQLPYKWTQTVGGAADEAFDVTSYEINPANIADTFNNQNVKVRIMKPDRQ